MLVVIVCVGVFNSLVRPTKSIEPFQYFPAITA